MAIGATDLLDELLDIRGRDVLDVGCGEGWLVRRLAAAGAHALGVDPLGQAIERARAASQGLQGVGYLQAGAEALPLPAASFDVVVFFNSLHHVPEPAMDRALGEATRVLRPGGLIYVQEPLASGEFFELTRTLDDETVVRAQAQAAIARALEGPLRQRARRDAVSTVRLADFEAFRSRMSSVEPSRSAAIDANAAVLRARFESLGRPCEGGREFEHPIRVQVLARADSQSRCAPVAPARGRGAASEGR